MKTLNTVHRRALVAASATMFAIIVLVFLYWRGVSTGALPSPAQPLVQKTDPSVATNSPPVKVVTVAAAPPPAPASKPPVGTKPPEAKPTAPPPAKQVGSSSAASKATLADAASLASLTNTTARAPKQPAVTNQTAGSSTPARPTPAITVTNITADDVRVARSWLENTNQRPSIRVQYFPPDILRLATELKRGLLVAGNGSTNRSEVFLQAGSGHAVQFSPFTKSVAKHFADYSIALNPSSTFPTAALVAYFPDDDHRLAFVPDQPLAELLFAHVARAARTVKVQQSNTNLLVFEGKLALAESKPVFEIVTVRCGGQQLALTGESSAPTSLPHTAATSNLQAAP